MQINLFIFKSIPFIISEDRIHSLSFFNILLSLNCDKNRGRKRHINKFQKKKKETRKKDNKSTLINHPSTKREKKKKKKEAPQSKGKTISEAK